MSTRVDVLDDAGTPARKNSGGPTGLFRAFWRWHFYASFVVAPILLMLAVTGLIYLLRFQLEPMLHADLMKVNAPSSHATMRSFEKPESRAPLPMPIRTRPSTS